LFPRWECRVSSPCWRGRRRLWGHTGGGTPPGHLGEGQGESAYELIGCSLTVTCKPQRDAVSVGMLSESQAEQASS